MTTTTLTLPLPISANRYWRRYGNRIVVSDEADDYKEIVGWIARDNFAPCIAVGDVRVTLHLYFSTKAADLDNRIKVALDALNGICFTDDKQVTEIHAYKHIATRKTTKLVITVEAL